MGHSRGRGIMLFFGTAALLAACAGPTAEPPAVLKLATTTSMYDSGLLDEILPAFEQAHRTRVDVIAVGTGQALEIGKSGDVDVVLVHNRPLEEAFVAEGYGLARQPVMYNDFILVGPPEDPAGVAGGGTAAEAFSRIYDSGSEFISRADDSGTFARELVLWEAAGRAPGLSDAWYLPIGQGMAETLQFADERQAYTLTDRGTYLSLATNLAQLKILFGGDTIADNPDPDLRNPYGLIQVTPGDAPSAQAQLAQDFVDWMTSRVTQEQIAAFGIQTFGQPLFYPSSRQWCEAHGAELAGCSDG